MSSIVHGLMATFVFAILGFVCFGIGFYLFDKFTPFRLWKEIIEDQNTALGILVGAVAIAIAIIISAAIHS